ncbi:Rnf-Nqr domain containing protein [uncultured Gemmiger sp.]|uniref:Rnf-Nqr domain containing protein n=1 Tax=uncultured Gemmiger sp. TaxID=1623490 RepID=UPI0025CFC1D4|nr:Rnf-Nqr domain containing protein [uncultured Gemmiger sp.]
MQNTPNRNKPRSGKAGKGKQQPERSQTLIIPQISPEMLESARRAAMEGKTQQEIEQAAMAAEQQRQAQTAQTTAETPKPAPKPAAPRRKTRAEAEAELDQKIHDDHLWLNNPVMMRGLGLAPVIAAAYNWNNAVMLCAAAVLLLTTTRLLAVAVCHLTGNRFRPVIYVYSAAILYIPAYCILYAWFGTDLSVLGIYLPLLAVESAIVKRMESPDLEPLGEALRRGINNTVGLCIAVLLVGFVRELLGSGMAFGNIVMETAPLPIVQQPAGGFILLGLIAAAWTGIANAYTHFKREEVRHQYAQRHH